MLRIFYFNIMKNLLFILIFTLFFSCRDNKKNNLLSLRSIYNGDIPVIMLKNKIDTIFEISSLRDTINTYMLKDSLLIYQKTKGLSCCTYDKQYDSNLLLKKQNIFSDYLEEYNYHREIEGDIILEFINNKLKYKYHLDGNKVTSKVAQGSFKFDSTVYFYKENRLYKSINYYNGKSNSERTKDTIITDFYWNNNELIKTKSLTKFYNNFFEETIMFNSKGFPENRILSDKKDTLLKSYYIIK